MTALFTTAYWPNLHYFYYVLYAEQILIEQHENYQKQSYRNRTLILTANGVLPLSIPVKKRGLKELTRDLQISYSENWQIRHWRAILSAYKNSPFFDYFEDEIHYFYSTRVESLLEYNQQQLQLLLRLLKLKKQILLSAQFEKAAKGITDLRFITDPKTDFRGDVRVQAVLSKLYYQTFGDRPGFHPNLSILDLLFNTGLKSINYLSDQQAP
jgi:hypothetical protein